MKHLIWILLLVAATSCSKQEPVEQPKSKPETNAAPVRAVDPIKFPRDEGVHNDQPIEWWYLNAHFTDTAGKNYGLAYCKFATGRHLVSFFDKTAGTAGAKDYYEEVTASEEKLDLSSITGKWKQTEPFTYSFSYNHQGLLMELTLKSNKKPLLPGGNGFIAMGEHGTSRYYALTDLTLKGSVTMGTNQVQVKGKAWMDHQWGKWDWIQDFSQWKWYAVQLDNGVDLMLFNIYKDKKIINSHCGYIDPSNFQLHKLPCELVTTKYYTDEKGGKWQKEVELNIGKLGRETKITLVSERDEQFMEPGVLWEGSMRAEGIFRGIPVKGVAYGELNRPD
jgi:predicted secreted hydrolase